MEKLTVNAPSKKYDILVGRNLIENLPSFLSERHLVSPESRVAVLTSPRIGNLYFDAVRLSLETGGIVTIGRYDIPDGEEHKSLEHYCKALHWLSDFAGTPGRLPQIITLGGGVVGDLGGFAAHTFKRGTPFIQVTTTLLGAVDCSVGGKVAVNLPNGKNMVGAFHQPSLVVADLDCLNTLPKDEVRSGMGEVIKYGAALDKELFEVLEAHIDALISLEKDSLEPVVRRCCELKSEVVNQDEYDTKGVRICLNFGHTVGHAIENSCNYALNHGDCVALGMIAAVRLSVRLEMCAPQVAERVENLLKKAGFPSECQQFGLEPDKVLNVMKRDKKWVHGKSRFVLLTALGEWKEVEDVNMYLVKEIVEELI